MNYLSHIYLSGNNTPLLIGNFMGDFVKGKQIETYPSEIKAGIVLHREIDFYTDNHFIVSRTKDILRAKHRHYAGVVADIFYDHFLAKEWATYSDVPLNEWVEQKYRILNQNAHLLPEKAALMLQYMIKDNWLNSYAYIEGIDRACKGLARRTKFISNMDSATNLLVEYYHLFNKDFTLFFPDLELHCKNHLASNYIG